MYKKLLFVPVVLAPVVCVAQQDEHASYYNSIYVEVGSGKTDQDWLNSSNVSSFALKADKLFGRHLLLQGEYSAQFFHPDDFTIRVDRLLAYGGVRYPAMESLDVFAKAGAGIIKAKATENGTDTTRFSESESLYAYGTGVNFFINEKWTTTVEAEWTRSDWIDEDKMKVSLKYHWKEWLDTGFYYSYRDSGDRYLNEGGIVAHMTY